MAPSIWGALVVVLILILAVGLYLLTRDSHPPKPPGRHRPKRRDPHDPIRRDDEEPPEQP